MAEVKEAGFFIAPNTAVLDKLTDVDLWRDRIPGFDASLEATKELREQNGTGLGGQWMHVASIRGPLLEVAALLEEGSEILKDKKQFYQWIDKHPQYLAYDRRAARAKTMKTFHGWKGLDDNG